MHSLFHALLIQHPRQLTPVRCAEQTIAQLHRYFEDVVLENNLAALVIEGLPLVGERPMRELARVHEIGRSARRAFFLVDSEDALANLPTDPDKGSRQPVFLKGAKNHELGERFVVIADARFSALLASVKEADSTNRESGGDHVIWTFEPDIVYSALEYLMARVTAERPVESASFTRAVRSSMPKATSLQLTVAVTTKLARVLQEQAGREIAVNRIATAIRSSLQLDSILQTTVEEVGRALNTQYCALRVMGEAGEEPLTHYHCRDKIQTKEGVEETELMGDLDAYSFRLAGKFKEDVLDGHRAIRPLAAVPLIYQDRVMGILMVRSDDSTRIWEENEILLLRTVADQVTVAVKHARLFAQTQQQALTDALTGCFNRRSFEMQLERDLQMATRMRQPVSLILFDIDHFKQVNDSYGHDAGDLALRILADTVRAELRGVDTAARYGGEEFAVILPNAGLDGAVVVAERLRLGIENAAIRGVGQITASFGVATFPLHAASRDSLVVTADRALYKAKNTGRNRVCTAPGTESVVTEEMFQAKELITEQLEAAPTTQ